MSVFDDLYDIDQENNLSIEIMDNNLLQEFKLWYDDISNDKYKIDNLNSYDIIDDNVNIIFSQKQENNNDIIILPLNYIFESPYPISNIDINYDINNENIILYLINPIYNNEYYNLTEDDLNSLKILKSKLQFSEIIIYNSVFNNINLYNDFINIIYNNFNIYPTFHYLTKIKETDKHKKYNYISSFITQDKIPKETMLYNNNINILYELTKYNVYIKRD